MPSAARPIVSRCGKVAAMLSWLATSRVPFAFMTMTRQSPLRTFQVSVCSPVRRGACAARQDDRHSSAARQLGRQPTARSGGAADRHRQWLPCALAQPLR